MNKHTIPKIVLNLLTTQCLSGFRFAKNQETRIMKLTFLLATLPCFLPFGTGALSAVSTICCDAQVIAGSTCKCYALNGSCAHCSGGTGTGCDNCNSTDWGPSETTGYESKTTAICLLNNCNKTTNYRCAVGYYGTPTTSPTGCTICPSLVGSVLAGTTAAAGATAITECYFPANTPFRTLVGNGIFTGDCYYTE